MHVYIDIHFLDLITVCNIFCLLTLLFLYIFFHPLIICSCWQPFGKEPGVKHTGQNHVKPFVKE